MGRKAKKAKKILRMFFRSALKAVVIDWINDRVMPKVRQRHPSEAQNIEVVLRDELERL
jgi:hypothetical protein